MGYKYILFDLDGTLTDPKVGITKSVQFALKKRNIIEESLESLEKFIGPPLKDSFIEYYSLIEAEALDAIEDYREYFKEKGIYENEVYDGIFDMLGSFKEAGKTLIVATSKPTVFANQIIEHFNMETYFDLVVGSNLDGSRTSKKEIISYVLNKLTFVDKHEIIMVGDRKHDIIGAKLNDIDSIAVTYGYGSLKELSDVGATYSVHSIKNLEELLINTI